MNRLSRKKRRSWISPAVRYSKWMFCWRTFVIFVTLLSQVASAEAPADRVLLILLANDQDTPEVDQVFVENANRAREIYAKAGFQVVEFSTAKKTWVDTHSVPNALKAYSTAKELHVVITGHGLSDVNHDYSTGYVEGEKNPLVTGSSLRKSLMQITRDNPDLKVYLPSSSCYDGVLAHQLADLPGVCSIPSTGFDRPVLLAGGANPLPAFLDGINAGMTFAEAHEKAWEAQVKGFQEPVSALLISDAERLEDVGIEFKGLPITKSSEAYFMDAWCASQNGEAWATDQFCESSGVVTTIPPGLKAVALARAFSQAGRHSAALKNLKTLASCHAIPADDQALEKNHNRLRIELIKSALTQLKTKSNQISLEEFRKNLAQSRRDDLKAFKEGRLKGLTEAELENLIIQAPSAGQEVLDSSRKNLMDQLSRFESECLSGMEFSSRKKFRPYIESSSDTTCGTYFSYWISSFAKNIEPDNWDKPGDLGIRQYGFLQSMEKGTPLTHIFSQYGRRNGERLRALAKTSPVLAAYEAVEMGAPSLSQFCKLIEGSIQEILADEACFTRFRDGASLWSWVRLSEIQELADRKLTL